MPVVEAAQERHPELRMASFDRGFHSPGSQRKLAVRLDECALPVKGGLSREAAQRQSEDGFRSARKRHPGIESAISHLEHCGLGRVRTHGADGFARAVALSVLAASVKRLGRLVRDRERKRLERRQRLSWTGDDGASQNAGSFFMLAPSRMCRTSLPSPGFLPYL
ncbi:MAG: hypothetical protein OXF20_11980 [Gammaproteobacteria bacterium]|nr:hypothetical protein [Gammaproteobacteria bacterium]